MAIVGLVLGLKGQDTRDDIWWTILAVLWAAAIGNGLGAIFDQSLRGKGLIFYSTATAALIGIFFGLLIGAGLHPQESTESQVLDGTIGAIVAGAIGLLVAMLRVRRASSP